MNKKKYVSTLLFITLITLGVTCSAAVLFEEKGQLIQYENFTEAPSLRQSRRVGIGSQVTGTLGMVGLEIELNLTPTNSFLAGFGGGGGFQSFGFRWKTILGGKKILPYFAAGYSRWYTDSQPEPKPIKETTPGYVYDRLLTNKDKNSGEFALDLFTPSVGLQYIQLEGPWVGTAIFA